MQRKQKKKKSQLKTYIHYSSIATQMAVIILAGTFLGDLLDKTYSKTQPLFTIFFSLSSIFIALYYVFKKL